MTLNMDTAIEARGESIRVGSVTRQLMYTDQVINGWLFNGGEVLFEGDWSIREWPQWQIARYKRAHKFPLRQLRDTASRVLAALPLWVDEYEYDDEGDYRVRTGGLRGWLAWHTPIRDLMGSMVGAIPIYPYSLAILGCSFVGSKPLPGIKFDDPETTRG